MAVSFGSLDHFKFTWILEDAIQKLHFLSKINKDEVASCELAEYEINKSLAEQSRLEATYADLLRFRGTLKGISNKKKLEDIQLEIQGLAFALKENTKKLGRLFRENPSFQKDAERVNNEKAELVEKLEGIINASYQNFSLTSLQNGLIDDMEIQDYLRKQNLKEQGLVQDIKQLHALYKKEEEELHNISTEKQAHIQQQKENLARHQADYRMETTYKENEIQAYEGTQSRLQNQKVIDLQRKIEETEGKKEVETRAFQKISSFLKQKEVEAKERIQEWNEKFEDCKTGLETKIENLYQEKAKALEKLEKLKTQFEKEDAVRKENEKKRQEKDEALQKRNMEEAKMEEAIKAIQEQYQAWKDKGGSVKKGKKGKGKGKKGKK